MRKILPIILSLLIATSSFAAELTSYQKVKFLGLNTRLSPKVISDDASPDLSNITLDETGAITDRPLFSQYNNVSGALGNNYITGLFKFYTQTGKYFVACAGNKIASGSSGVWSDITNAGIAPVPSYYWSAVSFNNNLYLFNASTPQQKWTGTGLTTTPADYPTTNCAYAAVHKQRVWAARSDAYPYRLYMSALNDGESWTDYVDLPDINQTITGLISFGGYLYIFTETNIYILLGSTPNDFSMRKSNSSVGAIAPRSIKVTDQGITFLSRSGVFAFDGNVSRKKSDNVENTILGISATSIQNACAIYDGQSKYWLAYTEKGSSYNNKIIILDQTLNEWYLFNNININYFERAYGGTDRGELYGGSSIVNGLVYSLQSATGTESITHNTQSDFDNGVTNDTVVTTIPSVETIIGNDSWTKALINFNGADGATSYVSEDDFRRTLTFVGNAQLDTSIKKFGTASLLLDGASNVTLPDSPDWALGDYWTIEFWEYLSSLPGKSTPNYTWTNLISQSSAAATGWFLGYLGAPDGGDIRRLGLNIGTGQILSYTHTPPLNTWRHIALVSDGTSIKLYIDGVFKASAVATLPLGITATLNIGYSAHTPIEGGAPMTTNAYFNGCIDGIRISKGTTRWPSDFDVPIAEYGKFSIDGRLTSQPMQINASGTSALGEISWTGITNADNAITFTTRTGVTADTVYFNGWEGWASSSSVVFDQATDATVYISSDDTNFKPRAPTSPQTRDILYFEDEDSNSASCVSFTCVAMQCQNDYADVTIPIKDLSSYNWIGGWIKSPVTGNSVVIYMDENTISGISPAITVNTVVADVWEKWYAYIGNIASASRDAIKYIRYKNLGDRAGTLFIGDSYGYDFYDSGDTMLSTPNNFIQYRSILGNYSYTVPPDMTSVTLEYTPISGTPETSLSTYYNTKHIDFGSPQLNKQFIDFLVDVYAETTLTTVYFDYDIDDGTKAGTFTIPISTTGHSVKLRKYFPSSTFGKTMSIKYRHADTATRATLRGTEIRYRSEGFN